MPSDLINVIIEKKGKRPFSDFRKSHYTFNELKKGYKLMARINLTSVKESSCCDYEALTKYEENLSKGNDDDS
jgi:hypothetical protein